MPVLEFGKEAVHNALQRRAIRARAQGPEIMLVVTPRSPTAATSRSRLPGASSSMRRSCCSTWTPSRGEHNAERPIRRWNEWMSCPFQLKRVCSCRFADRGEGVHTWYYVGASFPAPWDEPGWGEGSCAKPAMRPSVAHTPLGVKQGHVESLDMFPMPWWSALAAISPGSRALRMVVMGSYQGMAPLLSDTVV